MVSRIGHLLLILAFLGVTVTDWSVMQSIAWARMLADNARVSPLATAIEKTLDGKHPCALCKKIAQGRQSEKKTDAQVEAKKLDFFSPAAAFVFNAPTHFILMSECDTFADALIRTPPVPPPRTMSA